MSIERDMSILTPVGLVPVDRCISYIESCGWRLVHRGRRYHFSNSSAPLAFREFVFTLAELRHAYLNGW